jgi:hypothetical protein
LGGYITPHNDVMVDVCYEKVLDPDVKEGVLRIIDFDLDTGAEAIDYELISKKEKPKPIELKIRKVEDLLQGSNDGVVLNRNLNSLFSRSMILDSSLSSKYF